MRSKELWSVQKNHATVKLDYKGFSWNENLQRIANCETAKSINLKENTGKIKSAFVNRTALWAEKLGCCLEYYSSWKNTLGKLAVAVNTGSHLIRVLNVRSITDGGNSVRWKYIVQHSIGDPLQLQYSWRWAMLCSLLCSETDWNIRVVFVLADFKKRWFYVSFLTSICVNN